MTGLGTSSSGSAPGGDGGEETSSCLLPATLEEFSKRPPEPKIHDPPKGKNIQKIFHLIGVLVF